MIDIGVPWAAVECVLELVGYCEIRPGPEPLRNVEVSRVGRLKNREISTKKFEP
jgi:hypothetical protein